MLASDIQRYRDDLNLEVQDDCEIEGIGYVSSPIRITRSDGGAFVVVVLGPLEDAADESLEHEGATAISINELMIRGNLPDATNSVLERVIG